ncbi:MAG: UDP-N-acetylmuramoyl-L-alanine--D-glutamate ligase [bacterium]|uniref:UDP-N-acetylmuramoylalanine--D-glutamate ligase n=2 Tax=Bacteria candidate phyla TaxID=1783234 RepID=A0A117M716_UNCT6|nr:MAG: UDP-N-acetylmuramoylalanine--D-glutamate ligase [candidate division TA06 bacterium 32_111]KUK87909.1 MAG: UDP-N-acetylmuramoylalanine--D-glutamate ligase [candidate division TA06 bacterium 34_109]MDI6700562.1 UDP-N-acetylmuramoyl-L-alanine--D-glutamate ligase [bacterium]HAF08062.1 UDP-N-acetylmuramoyl-L-alanine--D-glutamate ligase [candidate division WOR-3 bacterium]HCP16237.1 UDP-N-acetylmuramoyl-L-alanine--D-glutamate ligase [candidate division WOR-3 bacterium]
MNEFENKKIGIVGFGRSGQNVAKILKARGAKVFISENKSMNKEQLKIIADYKLDFEIGHSDQLLSNEIIVISPGVDNKIDIIKKAKLLKIPLFSEIEIASRFLKNKIIAITGTNGKSTTAFLTYQLLKMNGKKAYLGGNISPGKSLSEIVIENPPKDAIITVEISSFQLENISKFSPNIGIITSISDDHLDRYNSFQEYLNTKLKLLKSIKKDGFKILNYDNQFLKNQVEPNTFFVSIKEEIENGGYLKGDKIFLKIFGKELVYDTQYFKLIGVHNRQNLIFALISTFLISDKELKIKPTDLSQLKGMEHRLEFVGEVKNKKIYNNSMCTNPEAFRVSLKSLGKEQIVILGGRNKNFDFESIVGTIKECALSVILIGEVKDLLKEKLIQEGYSKFYLANSLEEAVKISLEIPEGKVVNFSPGFSSFDMFKNFIERGNKFKEIVKKYERSV